MKQIEKHEYANLMIENRYSFYRIAYSYVKNEQEALDIVSEATYRGLLHIGDLRERKYFKTWMTRIVINTALETIRKNKKVHLFEDCTPWDEAGKSIELEIKFDLYVALEALSAEDKGYIILKYFEEYSFKEISDILGMPESTIKSKVYRCLKKMRAYMEGDQTCSI